MTLIEQIRNWWKNRKKKETSSPPITPSSDPVDEFRSLLLSLLRSRIEDISSSEHASTSDSFRGKLRSRREELENWVAQLERKE